MTTKYGMNSIRNSLILSQIIFKNDAIMSSISLCDTCEQTVTNVQTFRFFRILNVNS